MFIKLIGHIKHFLAKNKRDNIPAIAGQSAFYVVLSFVPFLMFLFAVISIVSGPDNLVSEASRLLSGQNNSFIVNVINEAYNLAGSAAIYTIVIALWSAGKGMYSVTDGITRIYGLTDRHFWAVKRFFAMGYTAVMILVMTILFLTTTVLSIAEGFIEPYIKSFPLILELLYAFRYVILFLLLVVLMTLALKLYLRRRLEDRRYAKFRVLLPGMALTALSWILLSIGFSVYSKYFGGSSVYGTMGTLVIALMWVYFSLYILLCGIQINYIYRKAFLNFSFRRIFRKRKNK